MLPPSVPFLAFLKVFFVFNYAIEPLIIQAQLLATSESYETTTFVPGEQNPSISTDSNGETSETITFVPESPQNQTISSIVSATTENHEEVIKSNATSTTRAELLSTSESYKTTIPAPVTEQDFIILTTSTTTQKSEEVTNNATPTKNKAELLKTSESYETTSVMPGTQKGSVLATSTATKKSNQMASAIQNNKLLSPTSEEGYETTTYVSDTRDESILSSAIISEKSDEVTTSSSQAEFLQTTESFETATFELADEEEQNILTTPSKPTEENEEPSPTVSTILRIGSPEVIRPSRSTKKTTVKFNSDIGRFVLIERDCVIDVRNELGGIVESIKLFAGDFFSFRVSSFAGFVTNIANRLLTTQSSQLVLPAGTVFKRYRVQSSGTTYGIVMVKLDELRDEVKFTRKITVSLPHNCIIGEVNFDDKGYDLQLGNKIEISVDQVSSESDQTKMMAVLIVKLFDSYDITRAVVDINTPGINSDKLVGLFVLGYANYIKFKEYMPFGAIEGGCVIALPWNGIPEVAILNNKGKVRNTVTLYPGTMYMFWSTNFVWLDSLDYGILVREQVIIRQDPNPENQGLNEGVVMRVGKPEDDDEPMALLQGRFRAFSGVSFAKGTILATCSAHRVGDDVFLRTVNDARVEYKEISGGRGWVGIVDLSTRFRG